MLLFGGVTSPIFTGFHLEFLPFASRAGGSEFEGGGVENRPIDDRGGGGVPEWSIGSPSSKGPSMLLFGGVTSPIFTNDFSPLLPVK